MGNDTMLGSLYLLMATMLVVGSLINRREPVAKLLKTALAWAVIFGAGFILFTFRDDFGWVAQRLKAEATGKPVVEGRQTQIPMAADGHFWVAAQVNGKPLRFLVDSGATMTTIGRDEAEAVGLAISPRRDQFVRTGNGIIRVASARAAKLEVGGIERRDVAIQVTDGGDLNVLGMNFLSSLRRWGVEGRWLILVS